MKYLVDIISQYSNEKWHLKLNDDQVKLLKYLRDEEIIIVDDYVFDIKESPVEYREI